MTRSTSTITLCLFSLLACVSSSGCPYLASLKTTSSHTLTSPHTHPHHRQLTPSEEDQYITALKSLPLDSVKADIKELLHTSQDFWPSDYDNYGPFFIRLAWHCSGSYRTSDGRGGCDGGRQRFEPEQSWEDNTNLDKARHLLWPVKEKYGLGLSWGDLFILAGTVAIEDMGGPVLGFCAGRRDDPDGSASLPLGPTAEQEENYPCEVPGDCKEPLGTTTIGLIYVNPEGPQGRPVPEGSAPQVRDTFARMGMNDTETVALIGGGHSFGKTHGACPDGAGPSPAEDPENPWPGNCGTGKGNDTYTSGFEGPWTTEPTRWDNGFFVNLLQYEWEAVIGPGGHYQWRPDPRKHPDAPAIMMLTSDISLTVDSVFLDIVKRFANDQEEFERQFSHAWYKLTTRDMGPVTRCIGSDVPPAQPFQYPLPPPPNPLPDFDQVREDLLHVIHTPQDAILPQDASGTYAPLFVRLAWQCASTFRSTDYMGGCSGARIRFEPEKSWPANAALDSALKLLEGVKNRYGDSLSWADLIVLAGSVSLEDSARSHDLSVPFTGGRPDAVEGKGLPTPDYLEGRLSGGAEDDTVAEMRDVMEVMGLTPREWVALIGGGHSLGEMHRDRSGFRDGSWTTQPATLDNEWFINLLDLEWEEVKTEQEDQVEYQSITSTGRVLYMLKTDMLILFDPEYKAIAQEYAQNETAFLNEFIMAWVKVMNADMF